MQSLEIISVNFWQILISLCNLLILFLILKKFLYKPVKKTISQRENTIQEQYDRADSAVKDAEEMKTQWSSKIENAEIEADSIIKEASVSANKQKEAILEETHNKAESILRQAEADAELEKKKAKSEIKKEIVDVSVALSEKMLAREISAEDHHNMIDTFLAEIGED